MSPSTRFSGCRREDGLREGALFSVNEGRVRFRRSPIEGCAGCLVGGWQGGVPWIGEIHDEETAVSSVSGIRGSPSCGPTEEEIAVVQGDQTT